MANLDRWEPHLAKFDDKISSFKSDLRRLTEDIVQSELQLASLDTTESAFKRSKAALVQQLSENEAELAEIADAFTEYGEDRQGVSALQEELERHLDNIGTLKSEIGRIEATCREHDGVTADLQAQAADNDAELAEIRQNLQDLQHDPSGGASMDSYVDVEAIAERTRAVDQQRKENDRLEAKLRKLQEATAKDREMLTVIKEHVETISDDDHEDEDIMDVAALAAAAQAVPRIPLTPANRVNRQARSRTAIAGDADRAALTATTTTTRTTRRTTKVALPPQHMNSPGLLAATAKGLASKRFRADRGGAAGAAGAHSSPLRPSRRGDRKRTKAGGGLRVGDGGGGGGGGGGGRRGVRFAEKEMPGLTSGY